MELLMLIVMVVCGLGTAAVKCLVLLKFYGYFIVSMFPAAPSITFWPMYGIIMFWSLLTFNGIQNLHSEDTTVSTVIYKHIGNICGILIAWFVGWVIYANFIVG